MAGGLLFSRKSYPPGGKILRGKIYFYTTDVILFLHFILVCSKHSQIDNNFCVVTSPYWIKSHLLFPKLMDAFTLHLVY